MAAQDLSGQKFYRWTVLRRVDNKNGQVRFLCRCECGIEKTVKATSLRYGDTRSCGCLKVDRAKELRGPRRKWEPIIQDGYALIPLSSGKFSKIDIEDVPKVIGKTWYCSNGYAYTGTGFRGGEVKLAWLIHGVGSKKQLIDHINGDTLDDRKENLRFADKAENAWNSKICSTNTSGFKGVNYRKDRKKFRAYIKTRGVWKHLGYFNSAEEASKAHSEAEIELHGNYRRS